MSARTSVAGTLCAGEELRAYSPFPRESAIEESTT